MGTFHCQQNLGKGGAAIGALSALAEHDLEVTALPVSAANHNHNHGQNHLNQQQFG